MLPIALILIGIFVIIFAASCWQDPIWVIIGCLVVLVGLLIYATADLPTASLTKFIYETQ